MCGGEEIEVDIRVVAATNKDSRLLVEKGSFCDDLYYRLNVVQIPLPPLRERREDIPLLVAHFVENNPQRNNMTAKTSTEAPNYMTGYEWPGNIRQLETWWKVVWCWCPAMSSRWTACPRKSVTRNPSSKAP